MPATSPLELALGDFVRDMVELNADLTVPVVNRGHIEDDDEGGLRIRLEQAPNWRAVFAAKGLRYLLLDSYKAAVDRLEPVMPIRRSGPSSGAKGLAHIFFTLYMERAGAFVWDEGAFGQTLADLSRFLRLKRFAEVNWISLANCRLARGRSEVQIDDHARIRVARIADQEELWNRWQPESAGVSDLNFECLLERRFIFGPGDDLPDQRSRIPYLEEIDLALKLLDHSSAGKLLSWWGPDPECGPFLEAIVGFGLHRGHRPVLRREPLVIGKAVGRKLPRLLDGCSAARSDIAFAFACRRFSFAFDRVEVEDQLIDCWIALEALFLPDTHSELSYRASMRIARFLGDTAAERKRLLKTLSDSYKLRSLVAHGVDLKTSKAARKLEPFDLTRETLQILRKCLVRWIEPTRLKRPSDLDDALLS